MGKQEVGKELLGPAIHYEGNGWVIRKKPFVTVNCAAIPANLLESELFGYKKGRLQVRSVEAVGKFQLADGGTSFFLVRSVICLFLCRLRYCVVFAGAGGRESGQFGSGTG